MPDPNNPTTPLDNAAKTMLAEMAQGNEPSSAQATAQAAKEQAGELEKARAHRAMRPHLGQHPGAPQPGQVVQAAGRGQVAGGEQVATPQPPGGPTPASLPEMIAAIADPAVQGYVSHPGNIYGQFAQAVAKMMDRRDARLAALERGGTAAAAPAPAVAPQVTDQEAVAFATFLQSAVGALEGDDGDRLVKRLMLTVRELLISHQGLDAMLRHAKGQFTAAFAGDVDSCAMLEHLPAIEALRRVVTARDAFVAAVDKLGAPAPKKGS